MARSPLQVLVIPFRRLPGNHSPEYAVLRRSDSGAWQGVAGGAEDEESPEQAARRELVEELGSGVDRTAQLIPLDAFATVPVHNFPTIRDSFPSLYVVPEYAYGVDIGSANIQLSEEHTDIQWLTYSEANALLTWDSNRTALWELNERITRPKDA